MDCESHLSRNGIRGKVGETTGLTEPDQVSVVQYLLGVCYFSFIHLRANLQSLRV